MSDLGPLRGQSRRFELFAAMRLIEQLNADRPRLGQARRPADDPVRLAQPPHLVFAPSDLVEPDATESGVPRLNQLAFGVFGPNGALPLHLTEYAFERAAHRGDPALTDFVNAFQHRFIALFYRAWAAGEPVVNLDRPGDDAFIGLLGALTGLASSTARSVAPEAAASAVGRAALFGQGTRSAAALEQALSEHFGLHMSVRQFVAGWLEIPEEARTRLGRGSGACLGSGATLGSRSWQCQHQFEIAVGPLEYAEFERLLPDGPAFAEIAAVVRLFTNDEWAWRLRPSLAPGQAPGVRLGGAARLGWSSWVSGQVADATVVFLGPDVARTPARKDRIQ